MLGMSDVQDGEEKRHHSISQSSSLEVGRQAGEGRDAPWQVCWVSLFSHEVDEPQHSFCRSL